MKWSNKRVNKKQNKLTDHFLDEDWFVLPSNKDEVDRNTRGNDGQTHGCFYGGGDHGDHGDEDGGNDVDDGEDQLHLDRPVPLRVLPPQPGDAEHSQANGDLRKENINCGYV